jgi:hypothetical protein
MAHEFNVRPVYSPSERFLTVFVTCTTHNTFCQERINIAGLTDEEVTAAGLAARDACKEALRNSICPAE